MNHRRFAFVATFSTVASVAVVAALAGSTACSFDNAAAAPDTFVLEQDVGGDSGLQQPLVTVFDPVANADMEPDFSCRGKIVDAGTLTDAAYEAGADGGAPTGELIDVALKIYSFGTGNTEVLPGAPVDLFFSNSVSGTADIAGAKADDKGIVHAMMPAGWKVGYHIPKVDDPNPKLALYPYFAVDLLVPNVPGSELVGAGLNLDHQQLIDLAITGSKDYVTPPGTAIIATRVVDCQRRNLRNVTLDLVDVDSGKTVSSYGKCVDNVPCRIYMSDLELPALSAQWSSRAGLVVVANLDVAHHYRAIAKGRRPGSPDAELIGQRDLDLHPDAVNVAYVSP
ncbi:MAG: hypothetical protein NVSMB47_05630 [Polyangiales bacterium]